MSGVLFQYRTYRGVDDWLLTLGPCRFFFGGGRRLSYLSEVLGRCDGFFFVFGDLIVGGGGSVDVVKFPVVFGGQMIRFVQVPVERSN
ncbi:hypothetical protein Bca4012_004351 [Brassica carinata]|uniref:Uncharacterized protein n=1 Tax=Brassica carinata TaxID=52824 RepID=A0A8X7RUR0_BRACI|nr:hypothetical protein Bca52824_041235 [Brassica carinata]